MAILLGGSAAAINSISGGQTMGEASSNLGSILDSARTQAMAHNTYVWVGIKTTTDSSSSPTGLEIMAMESQTGQASDILPANAANLRPVMKPRFMPNVNLSPSIAALPGMASTTSTSTTVDISSSSIGSFSANVAGTPVTFTNLIQFSPQGEALDGPNLVQWVNVGLAPIHGKSTNVAALQVSGASGEVRIFQP
jgi:hypothetical protein